MSLPDDLCQMLKEIEREQSYEELKVLRKVVMRRIKMERSLAEVCISLASTRNYFSWKEGRGGG